MLQIRSISIFGFFGFLVGIVHVTVFAIRNIRTLFQFNSYVPKYDFKRYIYCLMLQKNKYLALIMIKADTPLPLCNWTLKVVTDGKNRYVDYPYI